MNYNTIIFIISLLVFTVLFFLSKDKYNDYIAPLDKGEYGLKRFMPIGFYILDSIGYTYNTKYDRKLLTKITEVKGYDFAHYYMQVYWANRITLILFTLIILSLIGIGVGNDPAYLFFEIIILVVVAIVGDIELDKKIKERRLSIQIDFPDFINKLTLLINAGMPVGKAWEKIVDDNKKDAPLYEELAFTQAEIRSGKSEYKAYEDFAKRCRTPEVTKFVSIILQNLRKGSSELVSILRLQAVETWEMRKNAAKKLGEEASTKLLFPMMIMFIAIMIIVLVPAIIALRGI